MLGQKEDKTAPLHRTFRLPEWVRSPLLARGVWVGIGLVALGALLDVNLFPVVTQDSLVYLDHSKAIAQEGFLIAGSRQVGYPLFLAAARGLAEILNADPLLIAAFVQRLVLVAVAGLAAYLWRWWAVPLLALVLSTETIAYTNFLLNEGLAVSLAVLIAVIAAYLLRHLQAVSPSQMRLATILAVVVAAISLYLYLMRFTYVVFAAIPVIIAIAAWRSPLRRQFAWIAAAFLACLMAVSLVMSVENSRSAGTFFPAAGGESTRYYYAWTQVFDVRPENRDDPELARFYDDGHLRDFIFEIGDMDVSYQDKIIAYEREIEDMLNEAGLSVTEVRAGSVIWTLAGGRIDDIGPAVDRVTSSTRRTVETAIYRNSFAVREGQRAFHSRYNDGRPVGVVITDPIGKSLPIPAQVRTLRLLLPLSLIVLGFHAIRRRSSLAWAGLLVMGGTSIGLGLIMAENLRFLFPAAAFAIASATALVANSANTHGPPP